MDHRNRDQDGKDERLYRMKVRGHLPSSRWSWFGAEEVVAQGDATVLLVRVLDQSDLYGRLRRIHDLNLQLISVEEVTPETGPDEGPEDPLAEDNLPSGSQS